MKKLSAFTFIEIMIAIVIFSVGILAVLNLVTNNLKSMDQNDLKLQATLLAKEGIELVYNLRDSNLKKELSWNCLLNKEMYSWDTEELSDKIGWGNQSDFEDVICDGYFGVDNFLQIGFDAENYLDYKNIEASNDFFENHSNNRLYIYSKDLNGESVSWYGYYSVYFSGLDTSFARYLSFKPVKEGDKILPLDKIMKVESHVIYLRGSTTGEVVFESFIGNY